MIFTQCVVLIAVILPLIASLSSVPPDHLVPPPPAPSNRRILPPLQRAPKSEPPGFMQRIARWFGFDEGPKDQQLAEPTYHRPQYRPPPPIPQQQLPQQTSHLLQQQLQQQQLQQHQLQQHGQQQPYKYKAPCNLCNNAPWVPMFGAGNVPYPNVPFQNNFGPIYNPSNVVQQYVPGIKIHHHPNNGNSIGAHPNQQHIHIAIPQLAWMPPMYNAVPFNRQHAGKHLEPIPQFSQNKEAIPTQIPSNLNTIEQGQGQGFEIVKSVPLKEFVSSIEYPPNVVHSPVIDLSNDIGSKSNAVLDVPKLTELGSYGPSSTPQSNFLADPIIVHAGSPEPDNFPEASSHNLTYRHENQLDVGNYDNHRTDQPVTTTEAQFLPTNPVQHDITHTEVEFQPSLQTVSETPRPFKKDRETPKNLLDLPIFHNFGSSPRPFTKDPSELRIHSSTYGGFNRLPHVITQTPWAFAVTPTSTYSNLDASGIFAGISPPAKFQPTPHPFQVQTEKRPKQIHQIIIPYTSKNRPRPFKAREEQNDQPTEDGRYVNWSHSHEIDLHEQQESKLVTATEQPMKKTTKYLTKILASNIRDLLKREHEYKNKTKIPFDITKLQKNIDDWTEQEFTSLTHKASTLSVAGRSKNIPNEYLTTTPSLAELRTATNTEEVTTQAYNDLLTDDELKKYEALSSFVENNQIGQIQSLSTAGSSPSTTTTTTTLAPPVSPFYIRHIIPTTTNEVWKRAKVSISPITKEKVYVITPQPRYRSSGSTDTLGGFKSPRFLVRPTPGNNLVPSSTPGPQTSSTFTPELFGLLGISAYSPPAPVETLDGHSKVITVVTPSPNVKRSVGAVERSESEKIQPLATNSSTTTTTTPKSES